MEEVDLLSESSKDIGRVTETITVISDQTKLLALSATIEAAGGTLILETWVSASNPEVGSCQNQVVISVSDTGTGIPSAYLPQIFDPHFTTKEYGKGSGLGLADVSRIVRLHGGSIDVFSAPFRGTTFEIRLPCAEDAPSLSGRESSAGAQIVDNREPELTA